MKIKKHLVSLQIKNPLFTGGNLWLDDREVGYIRGRSTLTLEEIEEGAYNLTLHTDRGTLRNTLIAQAGVIHSIHLAHEFQESEIEYRFKEASELAVNHSNLERLKELAAIPGILIKRSFEEGKSLLHMAVDSFYYEGARVLLEMGASPNSKDRFGSTPLMCAVEKSNIDLVKKLLRYGAEANLRDCHNENVLMKGITNHRNAMNIFEILLEREVEMDIKSSASKLTPLLKSLANKEFEKFALILIEKGEKKDLYIKDSQGSSSLDLALTGGSIKCIRKLIEMEVAPLSPKSLYKAIDTEDLDIMSYVTDSLVERGWDIDMAGDNGVTLLMHCCSLGYLEGVNFLLDRGASLERRDFQGETPLFYSLYHPNICSLLIEMGADREHENLKGETPLIKLIPEKFRVTSNILLKG
ncbi:hypothetical protein PM10SUCC1_23270 [Propionigenium maris DSM 9537]|uniref:Ankyrin repeat n=1 Tax=Propionigenium maris DSM 9537 TaxID=1123000 RepID=A0A9W6GKI7_9FUSO|nr:ankyrin repeat domain-containing protein [Propionigenium maris]GLI56813.1 hypothetical protein PM10SUCC1_23270 [Propionigenium maris DSM 9537]